MGSAVAFVKGALVLVLLFCMACGGDDGNGGATDPPINQRPTIALNIDPGSGRAPLTTQISVTCSDTDGSISEYRLDADGQSGFEIEQAGAVDASQSFDSTTTVRAQCEDDRGAPSSTALVVVAVTQNQAPTALLTVDPSSGTAPLVVQIDLTCTDSDGSVSLYELDVDGKGTFEVSQASAISVAATLEATVLIRGRCTDDEGSTGTPVGQPVVITSPLVQVPQN